MGQINRSYFKKQNLVIFNYLKNIFEGKLNLKSSLANIIYIFFGLFAFAVILLYLIAPFNPFLLRLLLFIKVAFFFTVGLVIFLIKS